MLVRDCVYCVYVKNRVRNNEIVLLKERKEERKKERKKEKKKENYKMEDNMVL